MRRTCLMFVALLFALTTVGASARAEVSDEDLATARAEREKVADELNAIASAYTQAVATLNTTRDDIERTKADLDAARGRFGEAKTKVARRAVAAYKGEQSGQVGAVLASRSMNDLVDRAAYLERTTTSDQEAIDGLRVVGSDLKARNDELSRLEARQADDARRTQALQRELETRLADAQSREGTLVAQRLAEDDAKRQAAEAEARRVAAEEEAARRAAAAEARRTTGSASQPADAEAIAPEVGPSVSTAVGNFICPVAGAAGYSDDFGDPRSGHSHQGNDLFAARGTPVVAVRSGTVSLQEGGGGGQMAYLSGGGDVFFYAHLDAYSVGDGSFVAAGQPIGTVGTSGNATADAPHLHFEIHVGGVEKINPYPTVSAAC